MKEADFFGSQPFLHACNFLLNYYLTYANIYKVMGNFTCANKNEKRKINE